MNVYTCKEFKGYWPVGTSAVVVAGSRYEAAKILEEELAKVGLPQVIDPLGLTRLPTRSLGVVILNDGNY